MGNITSKTNKELPCLSSFDIYDKHHEQTERKKRIEQYQLIKMKSKK